MNMKGYLLEVEIFEMDIEIMLEHLEDCGCGDFDITRINEDQQMLLLKYWRELCFYWNMLHDGVERFIDEQKRE